MVSLLTLACDQVAKGLPATQSRLRKIYSEAHFSLPPYRLGDYYTCAVSFIEPGASECLVPGVLMLTNYIKLGRELIPPLSMLSAPINLRSFRFHIWLLVSIWINWESLIFQTPCDGVWCLDTLPQRAAISEMTSPH